MISNYQKALNKKLFVSVEPKKLKKSHIDSKIRNAIFKINSSDWVWTLWSCQGHFKKDKYQTLTYISFCCVKGQEPILINKIFESIKKYNNTDQEYKKQPECIEFNFEFFDDEFTKINLYFLNCRTRFAINKNIQIINLLADQL